MFHTLFAYNTLNIAAIFYLIYEQRMAPTVFVVGPALKGGQQSEPLNA